MNLNEIALVLREEPRASHIRIDAQFNGGERRTQIILARCPRHLVISEPARAFPNLRISQLLVELLINVIAYTIDLACVVLTWLVHRGLQV